MVDYLCHLNEGKHNSYVDAGHFNRDLIHPHNWQKPRVGEVVRLFWSSFRNKMGWILGVNEDTSTVHVMIREIGRCIHLKDVPFYALWTEYEYTD